MNTTEQLRDRRTEILQEMGRLEPMRRGSVNEQYLTFRSQSGRRSRRGPYVVYSFKQAGKTRSRRLQGEREATRYRQQIEAFRRYQQLAEEFVAVSQQLADLTVTEEDAEKKTSRS
jgi:hypothetical protein